MDQHVKFRRLSRHPLACVLVILTNFCAPIHAAIGGIPSASDTPGSTGGTVCGPTIDAGTVANLQMLLSNLGVAEADATSAAQQYITYMNALLDATTAYNAAAANQVDPTTLQSLASNQSSAASALSAATASVWAPAYSEWSNAYGALISVMDSVGIDASLFSCYGITPGSPAPVSFSCSEPYTGQLVSVDNEGPLFLFLNEQGSLNHYSCTQTTP